MFKRSQVRCTDCGFLGHAESDDPFPATVTQTATLDDRDPETWYSIGGRPHFGCFRHGPAHSQLTQAHDEDEVLSAIREQRPCPYFEQFVPGATFDWHIDNQQRRHEHRRAEYWQWARLVVGVGFGFVLGMLTRFLF